MCISSVWSLLCLMRVYLGLLHLLLWKNGFSPFRVWRQIIFVIVYIGSTCSHFIKLRSSHSGKFLEIRFSKNSQNFQRITAQVSFKYFVHCLLIISHHFLCTAQKMRFSIKDFFSKCDQIRIFMRIWPYLQKKSLIENFIFCAVIVSKIDLLETTILRRN